MSLTRNSFSYASSPSLTLASKFSTWFRKFCKMVFKGTRGPSDSSRVSLMVFTRKSSLFKLNKIHWFFHDEFFHCALLTRKFLHTRPNIFYTIFFFFFFWQKLKRFVVFFGLRFSALAGLNSLELRAANAKKLLLCCVSCWVESPKEIHSAHPCPSWVGKNFCSPAKLKWLSAPTHGAQ